MKIHLARRFWIHHTWPGATKLLYMYYLDQHAYALLDLRFFVGWKENETQDRHSFLMTLLFRGKFVGKSREGDRIYFVMFDPPFSVSWIADDWREITRVIQMCLGSPKNTVYFYGLKGKWNTRQIFLSDDFFFFAKCLLGKGPNLFRNVRSPFPSQLDSRWLKGNHEGNTDVLGIPYKYGLLFLT